MYKLNELFAGFTIPANEWIQTTILWAVIHLRPVFLAIKWPVSNSLELLDQFLRGVPALITVVAIGLLAWRASGTRLAVWSIAGFLLIGFLGLWDMAMTTVAMVLTSVIFCVVIGVPIGILASRSSRLEKFIRPVLDAMQTTPTFVYLVPIVMLFGIGNVPAVIATIIVALPPTIRLTSLGLREVDEEMVEAGRAFGCTSMQLLREIQVPLAMPTIVTGINQSLMLSLSMVVIAALIGAGGLGLAVYSGINRLDVGVAATAGLAIVLIAIITDRIGQAFVNRHSNN
ncbi:glycine/betaine ABC transporter permease [Kaistia sp. 32K]|uniref:ABC transporter permease n=1 Tax=Kaistia sp. 32K TaxID=2795690 RepID=UPI0019164286|nr:proline/glycine betaine ABC transporter permease [Kaistia sp. 32K]BCP54006.1 glycine/betaine ABC transporter permease [Kaistia sp. 32K]